MHVKERMQSIEEKNQLQQECDKYRKLIEELESDKSRMQNDIERLKVDIDYSRKEYFAILQKFKYEFCFIL